MKTSLCPPFLLAALARGTALACLALLVGCGAEETGGEEIGSDTAALSGEGYRLDLRGTPSAPKPVRGFFKSVAGLSYETEAITMSDGVTNDGELVAWFARAAAGSAERRSGTITVLDQDLVTVIARVSVTGALPLTLDSVEPRGSGCAMQKIEIANEKIERVAR